MSGYQVPDDHQRSKELNDGHGTKTDQGERRGYGTQSQGQCCFAHVPGNRSILEAKRQLLETGAISRRVSHG
jgi:hypothetical protein